MASQWDSLRQNLGEWQGSFTVLSPTGEIRSNTPSVLTLEELTDRNAVHFVLRRWPEGQPTSEIVMEFTPPGPGPDVLFFDSGSFSQGPAQWLPDRLFGCELGFTTRDRRLRLVAIFERGIFNRITVIRERRAGSDAAERPALTAADLVGTWQGIGVRLFPDLRSPQNFENTLQVKSSGTNKLEFWPDRAILDTDEPQPAQAIGPQRICSIDMGRNWQLLPDGGFLGYPQKLQSGQAFAIEAGWHLSPDCRERLVRRYGERGEWIDLSWIRETRTAAC
ncbi:protein of unknown function (DUF3598) [Rubidibacter lacunae KORDI 51-2]|uniref:Uncharacterized protein n=1 Tax=Rubidibacter lacunae KORDI 51-2 TaxID=582515 RepID=U5DMX1_9CHRO|nr:DUF3598 family protein [Rubidibacter lacunae]ERN41964.1 protein of unknown function (DUF3598) [Rubidibacter lacunae KORDI 51-2]